MNLPVDYLERVYAGVLGKLIGVYLGRPIEGWTYEEITARFGEVSYYIHEALEKPLIVSDDDISGTFTFLRALPEHGNSRDLTSAQIGQTWLNHIIENRTILWWGGMGNSTEHTAFLRLKNGIEAPQSGSKLLNSKVVSEQVGAQIFIDGWAMVAPNDPELAANLAERAARVSHDGEAVYAAQVLAAMESLAFVESDIERLLDVGVSLIPPDSVIATMIADLRAWHADGLDWRETRAKLESGYGYDKYGGNCHVVPNHGLIIHALLHGAGNFHKSLKIVNTCGWDTDCNSGNLGCLLGIRNGLSGLEGGPDWRGPVADRLFLPGPDGGRAITDALTETYHVVNIGRVLAGHEPVTPKNGSRFHFELPGSVQGFRFEHGAGNLETVALENVEGRSHVGHRCLALRFEGLEPGQLVRAATPTFLPPNVPLDPPRGSPWKYRLLASPSLYPGQVVRALLEADCAVRCRLYICVYGTEDELERVYGPEVELRHSAPRDLEWRVPDTLGRPVAEVGLEITAANRTDGSVCLDFLTWDGEPDTVFTRPVGDGPDDGLMWLRAWVDAADRVERRFPESFRVIQNHGTGMLIQGARDWRNYTVSAALNPHMVRSAGLGARVQGLRRYYALMLEHPCQVRLIKMLDEEHVLAEAPFGWEFGGTYELRLEVMDSSIKAWVDGQLLFYVEDNDQPLKDGGVALVVEEGRLSTNAVTVRPVEAQA